MEIFPECYEYRNKKSSKNTPFQCFLTMCSADQFCMEKFAPRIKMLFEQKLSSELIFVYWHQGSPVKEYRGCEFWADNRDVNTRFGLREENLKSYLNMAKKLEVFPNHVNSVSIQ